MKSLIQNKEAIHVSLIFVDKNKIQNMLFRYCISFIKVYSSRFIHQGISLEDYEKQLNMILTHCISI